MTSSLDAQAALKKLESTYLARQGEAATNGQSQVGYLCDNIPEELIVAAGFRPMRLAGRPGRSTDHIKRYLLPYIASDRQRLEWTDSLLDKLLAGEHAHLDYLVIPHNRHAVQAIYQELLTVNEHFPEIKLPECYYLDLAYSPGPEAEAFNRRSLEKFRKRLEDWSAKRMADADLEAAIATCNANRRLLQAAMEQRLTDPPQLTGVEALHLLGSSRFMDKQDHNALLEALLTGIDELPARQGVRIFVGGSPLDHTGLYRIIEDLGAIVVAEDHCWGARLAEGQLPTDIEPMAALAERFNQQPACSIRFPLENSIQATTDRALAAGADAAIFWCARGDRSQVWETPDEIRALEAKGIPCLHLKEQDYALQSAELQSRIADFIHAQQ